MIFNYITLLYELYISYCNLTNSHLYFNRMTELFYHGIYVLISFAHGFSMFLYVIQNILDIPFVYF